MSSPRNTEPLANGVLARALMRRNPDWNDETLHAERTQVIQQHLSGTASGKRPDILINAPSRQPVIVETEYDPARTVEQDAVARLGTRLHAKGAEIEGVLSVVLPATLRSGSLDAIEQVEFRYAAHYLNAAGRNTRWPPEEWLQGGVDELADAIEHLSLSERQLARGTEILEQVVRWAAAQMAERAGKGPMRRIARKLHQGEGSQTERMAAAIFVSAFVFHAAIEGQDGIPPVPVSGAIDKGSLLNSWDAILEVNYWPIFSIAKDLLTELPIRAIPRPMNLIAGSISELAALGATTYHDLTGRMFQTLIADRKFLATFYTLPESACLLAELAVERLDVDWSDRTAIEALRIGDFACGTGALLAAAQRAMYRRHRRSGGDDKDLHGVMMERVLTGLDIMPAATHLTCSMLSSAHPALGYRNSRIHTLPYGRVGGGLHIGALDLLSSDHSYSLFATGESLGGTESDNRKEHSVAVEDGSYDLVIMNPPFTSPTNHEGRHGGVPLPPFAGFGTSHDEQYEMEHSLRKAKGLFGSGHAGLASNFMDLGHCKVKDGGVLALVAPFTFAQGNSWKRARQALQSHYSDIHVTSIVSAGSTERAFSADTGMAECLIVATKGRAGQQRAQFWNLAVRPVSLLEAAVSAKHARRLAEHANLLSGSVAGIRSESVIKAARDLEAGRLRLPRCPQPIHLPIVSLCTVAKRGLVDRDINGGPTDRDKTGLPQGPFVKRALRQGEVPTWPMLWAHAADRERGLVVQPDSCGTPRPGDETRASDRWNRAASRLHANRDFRLNSQSLAMCLTPEKSLGGRAWPNAVPYDPEHEIPLLLWANSTPGLILFWWHGTRQQQGRACITITRLPSLPVLDPRTLTEEQLKQCCATFEDITGHQFLPANEAYRDETRKALDRNLLFGKASVLKLDPGLEENLDLLRNQWCAEPSVHGGKSTRFSA